MPLDINPLYDYGDELNAVLGTMIACSSFLVIRDQKDLAIAMRDEFMERWEIDYTAWNQILADTVDYVRRKSGTPDADTRVLMELVASA